MRFKAAVLHEVGKPLVIEEIAIDDLAPNDVLIRVHASGLCHTDLEVMQGTLPYPLPIVLGHEGAGVVERIGSAVTQVKPGDHVICSWNPSCGHCFYCDRAQPILCEPYKKHQPNGHLLDGRSRLRMGKTKVHHFSVVSSHAQYCVVPESGAVRIPPEMPFEQACLIGCGVMTGVGAVSRLAKVEAGSTVAVIGCGAVGVNAIQAAGFEQASCVIAIDRDPAKLALARTFGATHIIDISNQNAIDEVRELTAGRGADYVFECAGSEPSMQMMYEIVRPGGTAVILGKVSGSQKVSFRFGAMMGEKWVVRSSYGGARPQRDFPWLAKMYMDGKLKLDEMISLRLPLDRINDGFNAMSRGEVLRVVLQIA